MVETVGWIKKWRLEIKTFIRVIFDIVWLVDGALKFQKGMVNSYVSMIQEVGNGQPLWLQPWFHFWAVAVNSNPALWLYSVGIGELLLGIALIAGGMRKVTYIAGIALSLIIWSVPEGFGGPYGPGATDIGTGIIYAFVFLALILINTTYGSSRYSVDYILEKRIKWWHRIAEFE